ncbi:very short patch repair endonuclease [Deinococcus cavernae]|uniref:Very short patch repair endonuclease n=1 Tax=Deinococcus cavernae TaxID=2320857 RepID=A0A418VET0_9DEIO|nr:very short patch repair endonuclease [Deinococcus cavernae]RJF74618.1 very short patch repair endonuclease [Deinococcus cavernae]
MAPVGSARENTKPELLLRRELWKQGLRYRLHQRTPVGRPDIVFPSKKVAIFIDGCFWHGCPDHYVRPRSKNEFWAAKLLQNYERDHRQTVELERLGWRILRFWEHEVHTEVEVLAERIRAVLNGAHQAIPALHVVQVDPLNDDASLERRVMRDVRNPLHEEEVIRARSTKKWDQPKKSAATGSS